MSIRSLKTFVAIAREGSFAAAAEALGLTQSAVSLQMKSLEDELQTELFDRTLRRPTFNARGRALLARAEQIISLYEGMGQTVSEPDNLAGTLHIGAVNSVLTGLLPRALSRLKQQHARIRTRVVAGLSAELTDQVDAGKIDAALVSEPPGALDPDLTWTALFDEPLVTIAPADIVTTDYRALLASEPYIRFTRQAWAGRAIYRQLKLEGLSVREAMELGSLEAIALMVGEGLGVSVVPLRAMNEPFPTPLTVLGFGKTPSYRKVGMVTRTGADIGPLADALAALVSGLAAQARSARVVSGND